MRVRVSYAVDVSDDYRRAINLFYERDGLATREQVRRWLMTNGSSADQDLMYALQESDNRCCAYWPECSHTLAGLETLEAAS